ncbi:MAG: hypothetical protein NDI61_04015 [Bdellovibrionaceae bacterium]|nr:hypothetical protein [Pseudobdellovibrionaceae bacterium]
MKTVLIAIGLGVTLFAFAPSSWAQSKSRRVVKPPGTFVPVECSVPDHVGSIPIVGIAEVCVGRIIVRADQTSVLAVQFAMTAGPNEVFLVAQSKHLGPVSSEPELNRWLYELRARDGRRTVVRALQTQDGRTHYLAGKIGVIRFEARAFAAVFAADDVLDGRRRARW